MSMTRSASSASTVSESRTRVVFGRGKESAELVVVGEAPGREEDRTGLPFVHYDGHTLPFGDRLFDITILSFVLHHCADQERVLEEALRVTCGYVVILESVYETPWQHRLLSRVDRLANTVRSHGAMRRQEQHLSFRTHAEWLELFARHGADVLATERRGRVIHRQRLYLLEAREGAQA